MLKTSLYIHDVAANVDSIKAAHELRTQLQSLLESAGFELRKWASSHSSVLADLDPDLCNNLLLSFESSETQFLKILGLCWYPQSDCFGF